MKKDIVNFQRKSIIRQNLNLIFGKYLNTEQIDEMIKNNLESLERRRHSLKELSMMKLEEIEKFIPEADGEGYLKESLDIGKGVILLSMHLFCCDLGVIWLSHRGFKMNLVYDPAEEFDEGMDLIEGTLKGKGINLIKSARSIKIKTGDREFVFRDKTFKSIITILRNNEVVAMLPDIHPGLKAKGVYVEFLGRPTFVSYAPILMARRTGAQLVPAVIVPRQDGKFKAIIHPALPFIKSKNGEEMYRANMQQYMEIVESYVKRYPGEYCWHQSERWKI